MRYRLVFTNTAKRQFEKLERRQQQLIAAWIDKNLADTENPRLVAGGKNLVGVKNGWRWRIGSYRLLGTVDDAEIIIEIFKVGHRRDVYQG